MYSNAKVKKNCPNNELEALVQILKTRNFGVMSAVNRKHKILRKEVQF